MAHPGVRRGLTMFPGQETGLLQDEEIQDPDIRLESSRAMSLM
jgi:hypothetical protein